MRIRLVVYVFTAIALLSCKKNVTGNQSQNTFKSDETLFEGGSAEEHFNWCHIYKYRKVKDNYGTNCPSHKSGLCINFAKDKITDFKDEGLVGIAFDNQQTIRCYMPRNGKTDVSTYVLEDTVIMWDDEFLKAYGLEMPVIVFPGKYEVRCRKDYFFIDVPLRYVVLKKDVLVFIDKEWVFDEFYDGFLGENDIPTGIVTEVGKTAITIEFRYVYNISDAEVAITQMLEDGTFELKSDIPIEKENILKLLGLGSPITLKAGAYYVEKCADGARITINLGNC